MTKATVKLLPVAVVGLLPRHILRVSKAVQPGIDVHFLKAGPRPRFPTGCQRVVLMKRFISRAWQNAAYGRFWREEVHLCPGGIGCLLRFLRGVTLLRK